MRWLKPREPIAALKVAGGWLWLAFVVLGVWAWVSVPTQQTGPKPIPFKDALAAQLAPVFDARKQDFFYAVHPIGTAKSVTIHEVIVVWKNGVETNDERDILQYTVRFTIYWKGPIVSDGFTKLTMTFDMESKRWVDTQILATNGITNEAAGEMLEKFAADLSRQM